MATLRDASTAVVYSRSIERAATPWCRTVGFLLTPQIAAERGLWFERCRAIHTVGMRSAVDVMFLDRTQRVIAIEAGVRPGRPAVSCRGAFTIVECGPGFLAASGIVAGRRLELVEAG